jgi:hypothetical protein
VTFDRIEKLVQEVQALPDPHARQAALDLVQAVMDLHASGLQRLMEIVGETNALGADPIVSSLLILHDLHPLNLETRVSNALPAGVELISAANGIVQVAIKGGRVPRSEVEASIVEAAPDATEIVIEGGDAAPGPGFVPLTALMA